MEPARARPASGAWIVLLALGGFAGNLALSLLDHAQNGFFSPLEWVPVGAAAFGCSFYLVGFLGADPRMLRVCLGICGLEALVGAAGFVLHLLEDLRKPAASLTARFVHGAPVFAPLLFANLALLAGLGLWAMLRQGRRGLTEPSR